MPCLLECDAYLNKGSQEYENKKVELETKLKAVKHIVDYYYGVERLRVPLAKPSGQQTWLGMAQLRFKVDKSALCGGNEDRILKNIAHHCSCDGIHFTLIEDLVSLLDIHDHQEAGYARILMVCANELRVNMQH